MPAPVICPRISDCPTSGKTLQWQAAKGLAVQQDQSLLQIENHSRVAKVATHRNATIPNAATVATSLTDHALSVAVSLARIVETASKDCRIKMVGPELRVQTPRTRSAWQIASPRPDQRHRIPAPRLKVRPEPFTGPMIHGLLAHGHPAQQGVPQIKGDRASAQPASAWQATIHATGPVLLPSGLLPAVVLNAVVLNRAGGVDTLPKIPTLLPSTRATP